MFTYGLISLFSATQLGLLGEVKPNLRAVMIALNEGEQTACVWFYFDGEISDEDRDIASVANCEISALMEEQVGPEQVIRLDYPQPFPDQGFFAYLRYEPSLSQAKLTPTFEIKKKCLVKEPRNFHFLKICFQHALLGKITPNIREVKADINEAKRILYFWFYFDGEISEQDISFSRQAVSETLEFFDETYSREAFVIRHDFPSKLPHMGMSVYWRNETDNSCQPWEPIRDFYHFSQRLQENLLGKVRPNLRAVKLDVNECEKKIYLWFYFDGTISDEDASMARETIKDMIPGGSNFTAVGEIEQLDYPQAIPHIGTYVYLRDETILKRLAECTKVKKE